MSKFKKFISLILALAMCLTLFGTVTFADTAYKASGSLNTDNLTEVEVDSDDDTEDTSDDDSEDDEDSSGSDEITSDNAASDGEETVTVNSDGTITLTIEETTIGHTYTIYQLLTGDITVNDDGEAILANAEAGSSVNTSYQISDTTGVEIDMADFIISALQGGDYEIDTTNKKYTIKSSSDGAVFLEDGELSTAVYDLIEDGIVYTGYSDRDGNGGTITFAVPEGYYIIVESEDSSSSSNSSSGDDTDYENVVELVEEQSGATISRCIVILVHENMSASSAVITLKNTTPTIDKNIVDTDANAAIEAGTETVYGDDTIDGMQNIVGTNKTEDSDGKVDTAAIGDTIEYELTGYLPDTTGYEYYYYVLTDTMSQGLTLDLDSFKVTVECEGSATTSVKDIKEYCILNYDENGIVTSSHETTLNGVVFIVDVDNLDEDNEDTDWISTEKYEVAEDDGTTVTRYLSPEDFYEYEEDENGNETETLIGYDYGDYDYFIYVTYEYEYEYDADGNVTETIATDEDGNRIVTSTTFQFTLLDLVDQDFAKASNEDVLTVYYTAELNADAEVGYDANTNNVTLEYSNNPNSSEEYIPGDGDTDTPPGMPGSSTPTGTTTKIWTYTYTTQITINKVADDLITYDDDGTADYSEAALSGAQFTLTGDNLTSVVVTTGEAYVEYETPTETYYLLTDGTYTTTTPSSEDASNYATDDDGEYIKYSSPVLAYLLADGESYTTVEPTESTHEQYTYETIYSYYEDDNAVYYELKDGSYTTVAPEDDAEGEYEYVVEYTYTTAYVDENGGLIYFLLADETYTTTIPTSDTIESYKNSTEKGSGVYITISIESEDGETTTYYFTCYVLTTVLKAETETSTDGTTTTKTIVGWVDSNGSLTFTGLNAGTYTLTETVTPDGYNTIDPITFTIGVATEVNESGEYVFNWTFASKDIGDGLVTTSDNGTFSMVIVNTLGFLLPSTGAIGQIILYALGILLVFGAGTTLIVRRRKNRKSLTN